MDMGESLKNINIVPGTSGGISTEAMMMGMMNGNNKQTDPFMWIVLLLLGRGGLFGNNEAASTCDIERSICDIKNTILGSTSSINATTENAADRITGSAQFNTGIINGNIDKTQAGVLTLNTQMQQGFASAGESRCNIAAGIRENINTNSAILNTNINTGFANATSQAYQNTAAIKEAVVAAAAKAAECCCDLSKQSAAETSLLSTQNQQILCKEEQILQQGANFKEFYTQKSTCDTDRILAQVKCSESNLAGQIRETALAARNQALQDQIDALQKDKSRNDIDISIRQNSYINNQQTTLNAILAALGDRGNNGNGNSASK